MMNQEKKNGLRKKLLKKIQGSTINLKGLTNHKPTDEDISNVLKEFAVDFLLKGFRFLIQDLHAQLSTDFKWKSVAQKTCDNCSYCY